MNQNDNASFTSADQPRTGGRILQTVVDAMLDSLTVEQQTKMASFLLRAARQQSDAQDRARIRSASTAIRAC